MTTHKHARRIPVRAPRGAPRACQRCGRRIPPVARRYSDPFCSRVCAEATYGTAARGTGGRMVIGGLQIRTSA
jgi:hypothetical protein